MTFYYAAGAARIESIIIEHCTAQNGKGMIEVPSAGGGGERGDACANVILADRSCIGSAPRERLVGFVGLRLEVFAETRTRSNLLLLRIKAAEA